MSAAPPPLRPLGLALFVLALSACDPTKVVEGDDTEKMPDECDNTAGQVLCEGNLARVCDTAGDLLETADCAVDEGLCYPDVGCLGCSPVFGVAFADPAALASPGVAIPVHSDTGDTTSWAWERLLLRPLTLSTAELLPGGTVTLSADSEGLVLYTEDGAPLVLPASLDATSLPLNLLVGATARGNLTLSATTTGEAGACSSGATVLFRAGSAPDLSGRPRALSPSWETAEVFLDTEPVYAALDATRHAERVGLPVDLYVVAHKTADEWATDASLADVSGSVETTTVSADGIAANTTAVWSAGQDAGDGLGAGYDLVMDFGQDGTLDPGDLIDAGGSEDGSDQAGLYVMGDLSEGGSHAVEQFDTYGGTWLGERVYYPADIAAMGELPLVVISHGNGHDYTWYDYLGEHLASWGYVVMAHQNNTGPGIETASTTTLTNTDYFLANAADMEEGVLAGHIDGHRVAWIGHSRGGEGVVRAYDRLIDGLYTPEMYSAEDIVVIVSIAPTVFYSVDETDPHEVPYGMIAGTSDGDVTGGVDEPLVDFFRIVEAADGPVQSAYVVGAAHNDFNCCGFEDGMGPDQIGRDEAQVVARAWLLAVLQTYIDGNPATRDELARLYDRFHAPGIADDTTVARTYRDAHAEGYPIFDDYQVASDKAISSSGGAVAFSGTDLVEGRLDDGDDGMAWTEDDPMNGMTHAALASDDAKGAMLGWESGETVSYTLDVAAEDADFFGYGYLSFSVCQGSRHPNTELLDGPLDFTVTLVDAAGAESGLNFADQGQVPEPYARRGLGSGIGWANEFVTVRVPVADFTLGSALDLSQIAQLRFDFGADFGSAVGRIGLDNVELSR